MKNILDQLHLKLMASAYIKSHIEYCSNLFGLCNQTTIKPLNILMKKTVRVIKRKSRFAHTAPLFNELGFLPVPELIEYNTCRFMHKRYYNKLPSFLDTWERNSDRNDRQLRNQHDFFIDHVRLMSYKQHPLFCFPLTWNKIPNNIKSIESHSLFSASLKEYLLNRLMSEHIANNP